MVEEDEGVESVDLLLRRIFLVEEVVVEPELDEELRNWGKFIATVSLSG